MENYSAVIVDNIKQEPEQHYFFEIPEKQKPTSGTQAGEYQQTSSENAVQCKKSSSIKFKKNLIDKKTYECGYCDEKFDSNSSKENHVARVHVSGSSWKCFKCPYSTLIRNNLTLHYRIHSKKFSCQTCSQKFSTGTHLKYHQQQHRHGVYAKKPVTFECSHCVCSYPSEQGLKKHKSYFHGKKKFQCDICEKIFKSKQIIREHVEIHFKIQCPICPRMLARSHLNAHIEQHSSTAKFGCDVCNKLFRSQNVSTKHQKTVHKVENVQCDYCNKFFKNKYLLTKHIQIHVKIPCSVCRKPISKCSMKRHMKSFHSSGEPFMPCKIASCRQKFSDIKELIKHQQFHIGTRRFKCSMCEYETKFLWNVLKHIKSKSH